MKKTINYSELFQLEDPLANQPYRLTTIHQQDDWLSSEAAASLFTGQWQPPEPITLKPVMGGRPMDILWSDFTPIMIVSQKIIDILLDNNIKGWATYPVKVYDKQGIYLPGYYGFSVVSSVGKADISRSEIIVKQPPVPSGKPMEVYRGLYFDESKWDGSEIFRIEFACIIITKTVKEALKKEKIRNILLTPLTEMEIPVAVFNIPKK